MTTGTEWPSQSSCNRYFLAVSNRIGALVSKVTRPLRSYQFYIEAGSPQPTAKRYRNVAALIWTAVACLAGTKNSNVYSLLPEGQFRKKSYTFD